MIAGSNLKILPIQPKKRLHPDLFLLDDLGHWVIEEKNAAPCYYIAYNLACAYSIIKDNYEYALGWLKIALRLNRDLVKLAQTDSDLGNLRKHDPAVFNALLKKYPPGPG